MKIIHYTTRAVDPLRSMTGIGRYIQAITNGRARAQDVQLTLAHPPEPGGRPGWLPAEVEDLPLPVPRKALAALWLGTRRPPLERFTGPADVVHLLHPSFPVPVTTPAVLTVHDLMPLQHPEWYRRTEVIGFRHTIRRAGEQRWGIIADSEHVAGQLRALRTIDPERISVVHLGIEDRFFSTLPIAAAQAVLDRHGLERGGYVVAVGNLSTRKNLGVLVRALTRGMPSTLRLVLAGRPHTSADALRRLVADLRVGDRVVCTGFTPDDELAALIQGALALVHPSVDEGFGIPPAEAMASGTPVIAADAGSLPEIVGASGMIVDPRDPAAWADAVAELVASSARRDELIDAGRRRAEHFRWERAVAETADATARVGRTARS